MKTWKQYFIFWNNKSGSSIEPIDLSTPKRFNKRSRERPSPRNESKLAKFREDEENENEERDIFNNEALENPKFEGAASSLILGASRMGPNENERNH